MSDGFWLVVGLSACWAVVLSANAEWSNTNGVRPATRQSMKLFMREIIAMKNTMATGNE